RHDRSVPAAHHQPPPGGPLVDARGAGRAQGDRRGDGDRSRGGRPARAQQLPRPPGRGGRWHPHLRPHPGLIRPPPATGRSIRPRAGQVRGGGPGSVGGMFAERFDRVRAAMAEQGVDALLLSVGPELPWLTGYEAMPLERLTLLVVPVDGDATLLVPRLEAPRVVERPEFALRAWDATDDPIAVTAELVRGGRLAIGDRTWARFVIDLQQALPGATWRRASEVLGPLRARKDAAEIEVLRRAGAAVDRIAAQLQAGETDLVGRTEAEVSAELGRRILAEGHHRVNFAIVAAGPNA